MIPKISVIVPCYNQAQFLDECLQSVLDQTYQDWECIIVNDGSTDDTAEMAKIWTDKDNRFKYIYKQNGGLSSARNAGIAVAAGEFILPLDADDKIGNDYLKLGMQAFADDDTLKVVYCKAEKFGNETGLWNLPSYSITNMARSNMIFCTSFFRKKEWQLVGGYDLNMLYGHEDWEFWIAILKDGGNVKCLNEVCFYYRIRTNSMTRTVNLQFRKFSEKYILTKHFEFFYEAFDNLIELRNKEREILESRKFIIDLFTNKFFGFRFFKFKYF